MEAMNYLWTKFDSNLKLIFKIWVRINFILKTKLYNLISMYLKFQFSSNKKKIQLLFTKTILFAKNTIRQNRFAKLIRITIKKNNNKTDKISNINMYVRMYTHIHTYKYIHINTF